MPECAYYNNYDSNQEHEQGNAVHAMHKGGINIFWGIRVTLTDIEVSKNLVPYAVFHQNIF